MSEAPPSDVSLAACPSCGEAVAAGDTFCEACGHDLSGAATSPAGNAPAGNGAVDGEAAAATTTAEGTTAAGTAVAVPPETSPAVVPETSPAVVPEPEPADGAEGGGDLMTLAVAAAAVARAKARSAEPADEEEEPPVQPAAAVPAAGAGVGMGTPDPESEGVVCPSCGTQGQWYDGYCGMCGARKPNPRDHTEQEFPGIGAVSDKGKRHVKNEDAYAVAVGEGFVVAIVCDGVSTTVKPEDASQAAADAALAVLLEGGAEQPAFEAAFDAARAAALAVEFTPHPDLGPPSCTYLASVITDTMFRLSAFGDCRGYWVASDGAVKQLTVDDSWATQQILEGMPPAEAYADNRAHAITRWISRDADPSWRPVSIEFEIPGPGRALLVSDGVWNYAAEDDLLTAVVREAPGEPLALAQHLVVFANDAGGADNITAVVVDLPLQPGPEAP